MQQLKFEKDKKKIPLADILRPDSLEDVVGIKESLHINLEDLQSMILWGPPGCGKTSIAKIISKKSGLQTYAVSAVSSGSSKFREIFNLAEEGEQLLLHVDEIHHLNKSQQDIFLPHIENGNIILIGTTTENPSFELRPALLSRCKVIVLHRLSNAELELILQRCEKLLSRKIPITQDAREILCDMADGDGRYLLNMVEEILNYKGDNPISQNKLCNILNKRSYIYDKHGEEHYNLISALHKSLRGSDVDAALYWFSRMLSAGENPLYISRRLVRFAVEDIGLADPNAIVQAISSQQAYSFLGSPEGELALAQTIIYLATSPKSNSIYTAFSKVKNFVEKTGSLPPPKHILNAPTQLMKDVGYSKGYIYDHDTIDGFSGQNYFPDGIDRQKFYSPVKRGFEREIQKRLDYWEKKRSET